MRLTLPLGITAFVTAACGGSSPSTPTPTTPPASLLWTLSGHVRAAVTGMPLTGITLAAGSQSVTTDAAGAFTLSGMGSGTMPASLSGPTILAREIRLRPGNRQGVAIDAISTAAPFSLDVWREMVFDGRDSAGALRTSARLPAQPRFVIVTTHRTTGHPIPAADVALIEGIIRQTVGPWTGNTFAPDVVSTPDDPGSAAGTYVIRFRTQLTNGALDGFSLIGAVAGSIELRYPSSRPCPGSGFDSGTVAHEIGHAFGFFHHSAAGLLGTRSRLCGLSPMPSDIERHHAAVAYARPRGLAYPDTTPAPETFNVTGHQQAVMIAD